jgi:hypothetical protein
MSLYPWGVVLDADVHLRSSARDLFLYLGVLGVFDPIWSEQIVPAALIDGRRVISRRDAETQREN